jgi:hypothetical protein
MKIEKNIEAPSRSNRSSMTLELDKLFSNMEVGDSFLFPFKKKKDRTYLTVNSARWAARNGASHKFTIKKEDGGFRIWRIL